MRVTLPLCPVLRTPACPGFGVSGDRKRACFDGSCCWGAVSPEWWLAKLPRGWDWAGVDGATRRERQRGRGFERVQMGVAGGQILEGVTGRRWSALPIERVQMDCGSGALGSWGPGPLGSFERVQMTPVFSLCVSRGPSAHHAARIVKGAGHSVATWPSRLRPMNSVSPTQIITGECLCHP